EILLSEFSLRSAWSLSFSEMAKKQGAEGLTIEIPTLAPAEKVLGAIERLQKSLKVEDLKLEGLLPKTAKQRVNGRFSSAVAAKCVEHFSGLIPPRSGREDLYTHVFRAVYATIAAHWFCPPNIPEHNFKAEIQGHFTLSQDGRKLPNYSARANYDDYMIGTPDGNRDGRLGIKLGRLPGLEVIEAFRSSPSKFTEKTWENSISMPRKIMRKIKTGTGGASASSSIRAVGDSTGDSTGKFQSWDEEPNGARPDGVSVEVKSVDDDTSDNGTPSLEEVLEKMREVREGQKIGVPDDPSVQQILKELISQVAGQMSFLSWFTNRIDALERQCNQLQQELQQERDRLQVMEPEASGSESEKEIRLREENSRLREENSRLREENSRLREENSRLREDLGQTQARLDAIQKVVSGVGVVEQVDGSGGTGSESEAVPVGDNKLTSAAKATTTTATTATATTATVERDRAETYAKLHQIIDALIAWNTSQENPDSQLRISIPAIKGLASAMGASYQPAIQKVLQERAQELEELHSRLMLGTRHNARVRKDEILKLVARNYLKLEGWDAVRYAG
ncbi:MAG: protelomerase family protein, partial [Cyanobacteriota bacterium]